MVVDSHDNLWVAQADNGLSRILHVSEHGSPPVIERAAKSDLTSSQTHALFEDCEGNIWIGTERGLISLGGFPIGRNVWMDKSRS
jgi:ligand-binding sensor domain-containing protein